LKIVAFSAWTLAAKPMVKISMIATNVFFILLSL